MLTENDSNEPLQIKSLNTLTSWLLKGNNKSTTSSRVESIGNNTNTTSLSFCNTTSGIMTSSTVPLKEHTIQLTLIPWTYKWSNNSCAYDCVITVLGNLYREYNDINKRRYSLTFPALTEIFESLIGKVIDLKQSKIQWINLFEAIYKPTEFQSLYNVWHHLLSLTNNSNFITFHYSTKA